MMDNPNSLSKGLAAEKQACRYLCAQGLDFISANYRCFLGEIDLIMQDQDELVFVEVRMRNNLKFGDASETVDRQKRAKLIKTALHYLQSRGLNDKVNCRFDVIGICYVGTSAKIEWITDAFAADYF